MCNRSQKKHSEESKPNKITTKSYEVCLRNFWLHRCYNAGSIPNQSLTHISFFRGQSLGRPWPASQSHNNHLHFKNSAQVSQRQTVATSDSHFTSQITVDFFTLAQTTMLTSYGSKCPRKVSNEASKCNEHTSRTTTPFSNWCDCGRLWRSHLNITWTPNGSYSKIELPRNSQAMLVGSRVYSVVCHGVAKLKKLANSFFRNCTSASSLEAFSTSAPTTARSAGIS